MLIGNCQFNSFWPRRIKMSHCLLAHTHVKLLPHQSNGCYSHKEWGWWRGRPYGWCWEHILPSAPWRIPAVEQRETCRETVTWKKSMNLMAIWKLTARIRTMIFGGMKSSPLQATLSISLSSSSQSASSSSPSSRVPEEVWSSPPGSHVGTKGEMKGWHTNQIRDEGVPFKSIAPVTLCSLHKGEERRS